MAVIEGTWKKGGSLTPARRKLAIGTDRMYALRDEHGNIALNMDEIIKIPERFYTRLYATHVEPGETIDPTSFACDVPKVLKEEVEKAGMKKGKAAGDDGITIDLLKEGGDIILEKLAELLSQC